jgi:hypothetical protein
MMSATVYETWVATLRRWGADPTTDLSHLPQLTADSLPPEAYSRLFVHFNRAIEAMMGGFSDRLTRSLAHARSEHEMAEAIVGLRAHLARRLQLANHPGLPTEIQKPLRDSAARDIHTLQAELERAMTSGANRSGSDRAHTEAMLKLVRDNSFVAILTPGNPLAMTGAGHAAAVDARRQPGAVPTNTGPIRRRVLLGDNPPSSHS